MNPQQFNFLGNNTLQNFQNNTGGMINQTSNESERFPGLTKQQETEIMNKANQANVTESQKNYMLNDMYQQQLRRNQIDKFAEERENTKRQLIRRAVESKDIKTSKQSKQIEKKGDVADMIRKYVSATQEIDLNKLNKVSDDQIIADFTADNPDVAYAIDDFTKSQMSSQYFSEMMGFSQFEEQQDEGFFKNLLNSITYGVETGAKGLKGLIDKGLDTAEGNSNESSYSMENLTAFDNYIQHKYGVSGSQLRESDKEVWQQERNLVQDNPEVLKQYMTTASEDALNFAEGYTDALFTATNPYMALGMKTVGAAEQEMGGGVLTWLAEKMGGVGEIINSIPGLSNYRDTLSPEDQQRFDAFVGNVAVGLILGTKNKKNIIKDPKTFLMENLQPNQITKNFVQSVTGMPDRLLGGTDSLAGGAKGLMSKATKGVDNAGNVIDRAAEWGAKKITGTATAQDKLYKAQEPRMNILSEKKNLERRRANSDRANELILDNGYKPTNTSERLDAHQKTLNKLWGQVMEKVNAQEGVNVDQSSMITALSDYIKSKKKLGVAGISSDIKALEAELKSLKKMQAEGNTDIPTLEAKKQVLNDLIDRKGQEASEVYKGGIKLLTQEIGKIEDSIISQIPGEFSELKRDVGALLDSYEDVFKADMKNQRKKGLGLTETYSRIEGIGDTLGGIVKLFGGDASGLVKGLGKLALGKSLAKASDVDFLIKQGFEDLANEKGLDKSQASSKTAKYQVADEPITKDSSGKSLTKQQQEFFKGSKVVDKNGNLLRVYHGTRGGDFTVFQKGNSWSNNLAGVGHWFTPNKEGALRFAEGSWGGNNKARAEEVYLDIKNPKIYEPSEFNLLSNEEKSAKIDEQRKIYNQKADKADGLDYTKAGGFFHDEFDHPYYEREIFQYLKRSWENDKKYDGKYGKYNPEEYRKLAEERNRNRDANLDYDKILKDFEEYTKAKLDEEMEHTKLLEIKHNDPYDDFMYDIYKLDSNYDRKWTKDDLQMALNDYDSPNKFVEKLKAEGYDGIIIKGTEYDGEVIGGGARNDQYVAFDSNQIKRTSNLNPTKNEDIRFQKYGTAGRNEKGISATEGLNIRNFKNGKTVQELANQYGIDTKIVDSISTPEGQRAYGMYGDRLITLSKDLKESTVPHELLHGVFDMVDSKRRASILEGIQKKLNVDNVQAEEWLADNFSEYYRTGKFGTKGLAKGLVEKVKQFFYEVKSYIDGTYKNEKQIRQLFDDIIDGKIEGEYGVYSDPKFQSVWHGSPADFEKFDSSHMGEGEGQQIHGWGHYVAKNKDTAKNYYAEMGAIKYKGKQVGGYSNLVSHLEELGLSTDEINMVRSIAKDMQDNSVSASEAKSKLLKRWEENLRRDLERVDNAKKGGNDKNLEDVQFLVDRSQKLIDTIKDIDENDFSKRNLYEVEIPDPIKKDTPTGSNYLEEGVRNTDPDFREKFIKPEQVDKFVDLLKNYDEVAGQKLADKMYHRSPVAPTMLGADMYKELSRVLGSDKEASKFLNKIGYDGIHYFGGRDGEAYVIFNDDALEITKHHKY